MTTTITHSETIAREPFVLQLQSGLIKEELVRRIEYAFRGGDICNHALAFYLEDMDTRGVHKALGFASAAQFAVNHFKMGSRRAYQLVSVGRHLRSLPNLRAALERDEITWSKVRRIATIATAATEQLWIERCRDLRQEQVEALLSTCVSGDAPPTGGSGLPTTMFDFRVKLDPLEREVVEKAHQKLMAELGRGVTEKELLQELLHLFLGSDADGSVPGRNKVDGSLYRVVVEDVETPRAESKASEDGTSGPGRVITVDEPVPLMSDAYERVVDDAVVSPKMRKRLIARDGHHCVFCHSKRSLMVHHVIWRSHQGPTKDSNLITLCNHCHGRVHDEYLMISGTPGEGWVFRDREGRDLSKGRTEWAEGSSWPAPVVTPPVEECKSIDGEVGLCSRA